MIYLKRPLRYDPDDSNDDTPALEELSRRKWGVERAWGGRSKVEEEVHNGFLRFSPFFPLAMGDQSKELLVRISVPFLYLSISLVHQHSLTLFVARIRISKRVLFSKQCC